MSRALALALSSIFVGLAMWHFVMAGRPTSGRSGAVPVTDGKALFVPSARATVAVGVALLLFAALVAGTAGLISFGLPGWLLRWLSYGLALGLLARAIGEFRYVGFFKRVVGSRFATLDTFVYSPLCLALAVGVALVAHGSVG
jgi:hypothetical protein